MTTINTATGPVDSSLLGATLMHEHIFILTPEKNRPGNWADEDRRIECAVHQLRELKAKGIDSIVDLTVLGHGRHIPRIQRIAAQVDLNILVATGLYSLRDLPKNPDELIELFRREICEGIDGTGVKASILKCATGRKAITRQTELVLRAIARVHRETNVPITTHSHAQSQGGLVQQQIFEEEGVDLSRVIIGHCGDTTDLRYLEKIMLKGSYIGMDRFGLDTVLSLSSRVDTVARLCRAGLSEKIVLSHDAASYMDWIDETKLSITLPNWHFLHISNDVIPALKEEGVTDQQIHAMLVDNPRKIFENSRQ